MTTFSKYFPALIAASLLFASCGTTTNSDKTATDSAKAPYPAISMSPVGSSPDFPDAQLSITSVKAEKAGNDSAKVSFEFAVKNYELKMQTTDNGNKQCNNSDKGQHIHFIMDNQPYKALYEPKNDITLANNTEYYLMAFLSRSYHESLKNKGAAVVYHFKIDGSGKLVKLDEPKTPMVFYSRPKGDYLGKDTANVLLDFYVWNCALSADGYKVKATVSNPAIPNHDTTITITDWKSNFLHNIGQGKTKVTLALVDKDGKNVAGDNTTASRSINLAAQEPIK